MMRKYYKEVLSALEKPIASNESLDTRTDAGIFLVSMLSFSFLSFLGFWESVLLEVNDVQHYLQTERLNVEQCAQQIHALQTLLHEKREEFVVGALTYAKGMCEELSTTVGKK